MGETLQEFLARTGLKDGVVRAGVMEEWEERVGERIARVARPRGFSGGTLFVEVRSSAWLMELDLMKEELLRRLNEGREEGRVEKLVLVQAGE